MNDSHQTRRKLALTQYDHIVILIRMNDALRPLKGLRWIGSSYQDFMEFPEPVHDAIGYALHRVQEGKTPRHSKVLKGAQSGAVEIIDDHDGDTYRAVYTVKFADVVYILHAFKKKSKKGIGTPKTDLDLIRQRLRLAEEDYRKTLLGRRENDP